MTVSVSGLDPTIGVRLDISPDGCWLWQGGGNGVGYGKHRGKYVHRLVYEALVGPIPAGLEIDHLCRNRGCANPVHLEPVTHRENTLRGHTIVAAKAAQTHCKHGHAFDAANTRIVKDGTRACRRCHADWEARHRQRVAKCRS